MTKLWNWLSGKKTYALVAVGVVYTAIQWYYGDITRDIALEQIWQALVFGTVRHGVSVFGAKAPSA